MSAYLDARARRLGYASYAAYLQSPQWRVFRDRVKARACYCCGKRSPSLQVHHISYDNLGAERPEDVVTVCDDCHAAIHGKVNDGNDLETAHEQYRAPLERESEPRKKKPEWVSWHKLLNKRKHQTPNQLLRFLMDKELSDGWKATSKAHAMGLVRLIDGKEKWNVRKYIRIMQAEKKRKKQQAKE